MSDQDNEPRRVRFYAHLPGAAEYEEEFSFTPDDFGFDTWTQVDDIHGSLDYAVETLGLVAEWLLDQVYLSAEVVDE